MSKAFFGTATIALLVFGLILSAGCFKPKEGKIQAEDMIDQAEAAGARDRAKTRTLLLRAERKLEQGVDKLDRLCYREARDFFDEAYNDAREALRIANAMNKPEPPPEPEKARETTDWTVGRGDTLWGIASREDIYNDPFLWPLIYDANKDLIDETAHNNGIHRKEFDHLYPGMELTVPLNPTEDEKVEARKQAGILKPEMAPPR